MGRKSRTISGKKQPGWPRLMFVLLSAFCLLILPLVHSKSVLDITLIPRLLALYVFLTAFALAFSLKDVYSQLEFGVLRSAIFPLWTGYLIVSAFSLFFAINPSAGLFDLFKIFSTLMLMVFATLIFLKTPGWPLRLSKFFIAGALISLAIGYFQYITELGFGFHDRFTVASLKGLMSNINLYASYLMLLLPFLLYGAVFLEKTWRTLAIVAVLLNLLMIFLLQTRAVYLGIMVSLPITLIISLVAWRQLHIPKKLRNILGIVLLGGTLSLAGVYTMLPKDNIYISRIHSIFTDKENPRLMIWDITARMIEDHPLTGIGAGNFPINLQSYYGEFDLSQLDSTNWVRPHNDYLWVLSEKGVVALLLFLAFFGMAFYYIWLIVKRETEYGHKWLAIAIFMGLTSYMVNAFFDFPLERINQQAILALFIASLVAMSYGLKPDGSHAKTPSRYWIIPVLLLLSVGLKYNAEAVRVEKNVRIAREANISEQWRTMLDAGQKARTPWRNLDPMAVPVPFFEAYAHTRLGNDPLALKAFLEAERQNPYRKYISTNIGVIYLRNGKYDQAIEYFEKTLSMYPKDTEALNYLADAHFVQDNFEEALNALERISEEERTDNINILYNILKDTLSTK